MTSTHSSNSLCCVTAPAISTSDCLTAAKELYADKMDQTWDKPLFLEVSGNLVPGREHLISLCVKNILLAGGVWKPISLMVEN
tara:strand:+ start:246 stop:494 length:249 start_codon:yes stop_codon:yes gene_type:complete